MRSASRVSALRVDAGALNALGSERVRSLKILVPLRSVLVPSIAPTPSSASIPLLAACPIPLLALHPKRVPSSIRPGAVFTASAHVASLLQDEGGAVHTAPIECCVVPSNQYSLSVGYNLFTSRQSSILVSRGNPSYTRDLCSVSFLLRRVERFPITSVPDRCRQHHFPAAYDELTGIDLGVYTRDFLLTRLPQASLVSRSLVPRATFLANISLYLHHCLELYA
ncbi:hypothetical protein B0H13DRAFT_2349320 [Mycena leptocephala]|nr:hypothetical protein B0H13DRAFT_2349320 [Mycena leptocephala]